MKAKYVKPQLCVEYFSLTQSVAVSCGWDAQDVTSLGNPTHGDPSSCAWNYNDLFLLFTASPVCDKIIDPEVEYGGVCYNAPEGGQQIFAS